MEQQIRSRADRAIAEAARLRRDLDDAWLLARQARRQLLALARSLLRLPGRRRGLRTKPLS